MDKVSLIITIYNKEKFLNQCLKSSVQQTYENLEIICVDDGSTDGSQDICKKYEKEFDNIKFIYKHHQGSIDARLTGVEAATGKYIGFMDGDDWIDKDYIEKLYYGIKESDSDLIETGFVLEWTNKTQEVISKLVPGVYDTIANNYEFYTHMMYADKYQSFGIMPSLCVKLMRRDMLLESIRKVDSQIKVGDDLAITFHYVLECKKVCVLDYIGYHYRQLEDSLLHREHDDFFIQIHRIYSSLYKKAKTHPVSLVLIEQINNYISQLIINAINTYTDIRKSIQIPYFKFPVEKIKEFSRIAIYGAGMVGEAYYRQLTAGNAFEVVYWADQNTGVSKYNRIMVGDIEDLKNIGYDIVLIAIKEEKTAREIKNNLMQHGIEADKIVWERPVSMYEYYKY